MIWVFRYTTLHFGGEESNRKWLPPANWFHVYFLSICFTILRVCMKIRRGLLIGKYLPIWIYCILMIPECGWIWTQIFFISYLVNFDTVVSAIRNYWLHLCHLHSLREIFLQDKIRIFFKDGMTIYNKKHKLRSAGVVLIVASFQKLVTVAENRW